MKEKIEAKLEFLKKKKEEYISQVIALNGAIQALEEIIDEQGETDAITRRQHIPTERGQQKAVTEQVEGEPCFIPVGPEF